MAGSIKVETTITVTMPQGDVHTFNTSKTIGSMTAIDMRDFAITANQTRILWDPVNDADENMTDFDFLLAWSDGDLDLELVTDVGADVGDEATMIRVVSDLPFMLGADDGKANVTAVDVLGTGTLDVVDKIRVDEPGAVARNLKFIMAT